MNPSSAIYSKNPDIVFRKIAGETILVPIRNNLASLESIYTLSEVAARIWELLDGQTNIRKVKDVIAQEYAVQQETAEKDISEFLLQAEELKLITAK